MPFAVFLDILGTSRAMTNLPDDFVFQPDCMSARSRFQKALEWAAKKAGGDLVFYASFSDCGYLIIQNPLAVLHAVRTAMYHSMRDVPVRGGIGYGNFGVEGTTHRWNGIAVGTEASFFGSAIVRAHRAESCGHKGFRILVHDSAVEALKSQHCGISVYPEDMRIRDEEYQPVEVPGTVVEIPFSQYPDVTHEVCYIGNDNVTGWLRCVDLLEEEFAPDASAVIHYAEARAALQRFEQLREVGK